jgi:diguanylate cyclase (GGDEF)-like protein
MTEPTAVSLPTRSWQGDLLQRLARGELLALLLLLSAGVYLLLARAELSHPLVASVATSGYALLIVALWFKRWGATGSVRQLIEVAAMTLYVTLVIYCSSSGLYALAGLYLLPVLLTATALRPIHLAGHYALILLVLALLLAQRAAPVLASLAQLTAVLGPAFIAGLLVQWLRGSLASAQDELMTQSRTDTLTGLWNIRVFNEHLRREHALAGRRAGSMYSILMLDIDRLQQLNASHGYEAGNLALAHVANAVRRTLRETDIAARYASDEFAILLPGTGSEAAMNCANRLRHAVYATTVNIGNRMVRCSVSIGVATFPRDAREGKHLLAVAEKRMYRDKELRRHPDESPAI